jgi:hypothetical protein
VSVDRLSELTSPRVVMVSRICSTYRVQPGQTSEVSFEGGGSVDVQVAFEVVGDQFNDLAAAEHLHGGHRSFPPSGDATRYRIMTARRDGSLVSPANGRDVTRSPRRTAVRFGSCTVVRLQRTAQGAAAAVQQDALIAR